MKSLRRSVVLLAVIASSNSRSQAVSQDYVRYSSMLQQQRTDSARRDQQALYDQAARRSSSTAVGGTSYRISTGDSGGGSAQIVGMLGSTLDT